MPTEKQLNLICQELQKIMRIQDYDIDVVYKPTEELQREESEGEVQGQIFIVPINNAVHIEISSDCLDWYITLVHELKHFQTFKAHELAVQFTDIIDEDNDTKSGYLMYNKYYEQMIDRLAKEFVVLYPKRKFNHILR